MATTRLRTSILTLLFVLMNQSLLAQQLSVSIQNNDTITTSYSDINKAADFYLIGNSKTNPDNDHNKIVQIFHLDTLGDLVQAFEISILDTNYSVELLKLLAENDGSVIVVGAYSLNNSPPYQPIVFKLNENGSVAWAKKIDLAGVSQPLFAKLGDGTTLFTFKYNTGVQNRYFCKIDQNGNFSNFHFLNLHWLNPINVLPYSTNFDIIFNNGTVANIENDFSQINWQKKYHTEIGINFNRTQNGDYIFCATKTAFPGYMNVFRTDSSGNLVWAKYVEAWEGQFQNQTTIFDIVGINYIQEDEFGHIVASANSEGGLNGSLKIEFDADGNFLKASKSAHFKERFHVLDNQYLIKSGFVNWATINTDDFILERRGITDVFPCDIGMTVAVAPSSDSLVQLDSLQLTATTAFNAVDVDLVVNVLSPVVDQACDLTSLKIEEEIGYSNERLIYPNPAQSWFAIQTTAEDHVTKISLISLEGKKSLMPFESFENGVIVDLAGVENGLYFVEMECGNKTTQRFKLLVE